MGRFGGPLLLATGIIHTLVGLLAYAAPLADIGRAGVFNAVGSHADRDAAVWFLLSGVLLITLGQLSRWVQQQTGTLPAFLGWTLLGVAAAIAILMPVSGWPLVAAAGGLLLAAVRNTVRRGELAAASELPTQPVA